MSRSRRFDWLFRPQLADEDMPLSAEAQFAEALAELPAVERSALALSEIGGLDTDEIAERLGTDPAVVRRVLACARASVRASLEVRGRRGMAALFPYQSWWQTGSSGSAVRAAGVVAAAVVGSSVAIGGAAADLPRATLTAPDSPRVRALERPNGGAFTAPRARVVAPAAAPAAAAAVAETEREEAAAGGERRRSVRPSAGPQRHQDAAAAAPAEQPLRREPAAPPVEREKPAPPVEREKLAPPPPARAEPEPFATTVARTVPLPVAPPAGPPPVELPVVPPPPPVPVLPAPVPELPPLPLPLPPPPLP